MKPVDGGFTEMTGDAVFYLVPLAVLFWLLGSWIVHEIEDSRKEKEWVKRTSPTINLTNHMAKEKPRPGIVRRHGAKGSTLARTLKNLASRVGNRQAKKGGKAVKRIGRHIAGNYCAHHRRNRISPFRSLDLRCGKHARA